MDELLASTEHFSKLACQYHKTYRKRTLPPPHKIPNVLKHAVQHVFLQPLQLVLEVTVEKVPLLFSYRNPSTGEGHVVVYRIEHGYLGGRRNNE